MVRLDSAGEKPSAVVKDLRGVVERLPAEEKLPAEDRRDGRSLQPSAAAVIAPLAEFKTEAPPECRAITDSPAWGAPAVDSVEAEDSAVVEAVSAVVVDAVAVGEAGDRHDHKNIHDRNLRAGWQ